MKMSDGVLTIFPTELAKRRFDRQAVLEAGVVDGSRLMTFTQLLGTCERAARRQNLLQGRLPGTAETRILLEKTVAGISFPPGQPLGRLSPAACAGLLSQLTEKLAFLAGDFGVVVHWLKAHDPRHKLHGFGLLLAAWRRQCTKMDIADRFQLNSALLELIESGTLPDGLQGGVHFRAVRWFNPFEERFIGALKRRLGSELVCIYSVLPAAHAEAAEDRLCAAVRSELGSEDEWRQWTEDFADAYEADDSNILEADSKERISFCVSAHPYGEIEDVARSIATEIEEGTAPDQIALILRDLGPYTDIVPDVFRRFGIPTYFRRGTPAASHPPVKALLALLDFPHSRSRDRLCDLLQMSGIEWPGVDDRLELVAQIRQKEPPRLHRLPKKLDGFFQYLELDSFSERANDLILKHNLALPDEVRDLIEDLHQTTDRLFDPERMVSLFEELLDNVTLRDEISSESGVWVVNPMDAAGLRFETVFIAGMDDRTFPQIPRADALFNAKERRALRAFLEERKIPCPRMALSETGEALIQEEILFLTALSCGTEKLRLSYTRSDVDGKERAPGEFFERMRGLTGGRVEHGTSFHTILPPDAVRAEDEARQTAAHFSPAPEPSTDFPADNVKDLIFQWLETHPEFSATALESLARNRYVFFLEKVLGIKTDRTHEDDTDPMDRGNVIHDILERVYTTLAEQSGVYAAPNVDAVPSLRQNATGASRLRWQITQQKTENSIPLAVFTPERLEEHLTLAKDIAEEEFVKAERRPSRHLGHPAVWEGEKHKLLQIIENFIRMDCETAQAENRYPALFEMKFDAKHDLPVTLERDGETVRLKGKIDRIDLIFDTGGELERILVVDYKSKSRNDTVETLEKKIGRNLDCQLALYTFAAQEKFFGMHNTLEMNECVQAAYHLQEREPKKMASHFSKKRLTMTPELTEQFLDTLFSNVWKFSNGDLATAPLIKGYEDYSHICRTAATDPKELLNQPIRD